MTKLQQQTVERLAQSVEALILKAAKAANAGDDMKAMDCSELIALELRAARAAGVFDATLARIKARAVRPALIAAE